ncbi:MAG TPA: hypothetical protein VEW93_14795 [Acidimicrobiales bacterium]|nr:hypothetical protein [Acidimicrobiales bacterium]
MTPPPAVLDGLDAVRAAVGRELGPTGWLEVGPGRVDRFRAATGGGPHQGEGAHEVPPLLLLALTNLFLPEMVEVRGVSSGINVGTGSVRFGAPVPVGSRVRARATVVDAVEATGAVRTTIGITVEVEGRHEPAVVVEALSRWLA